MHVDRKGIRASLWSIATEQLPQKRSDPSAALITLIQADSDHAWIGLRHAESRSLLTFLTALCVVTGAKAEDRSPTVASLFLLTVIAEYFSATFSLSFTSLLACFTSNLASAAESDMSQLLACIRDKLVYQGDAAQ